MVDNNKFKTVFLIDDDKLTNFINKRIMERAGLNVIIKTFDNATAALATLRHLIATDYASLPEVILLDINMPEVNGWEFLEEYRRLLPSANCKIYMLTASLDQKDVRKSEQYQSIYGFMCKPLQSEQLHEILEELVKAA